MSTLLVFVICFLAAIKATNLSEKAINPNTVLCYGPKGHRGHRGPVGDRGPVGEPGLDGKNGVNATDPGFLNVIELWSTTQFPAGDVFFTNARWTSGYSIQDPISGITVQATGLYMLYYYILDSEAYFETYVNSDLAFVIDISQFGNDQIWYQYPLYLEAGQVVSFKSPYMALPFTIPTFPESSNGALYSVTLQLIIP